MTAATDYYDQHADKFFEQYRSLGAAEVLKDVLHAIPAAPSLVLDVASGSGRDSEYLASLGHTVVSVEPAKVLRDKAVALGQGSRILQFDSSLPFLEGLDRFDGGFDFILCAAAWMHLNPLERGEAACRLHALLKKGGRAAVTYKVAPPEPERAMFAIHAEQVEEDFRLAGFLRFETRENVDLLGRGDTRWFSSVFHKD
jgi:SAM-dependent methyltransferase